MKISIKSMVWLVCCASVMLAPAASAAENDEIIALMESISRVTQSTYSTMIVEKLKKDGTGESSDASEKKGFVPTSEEFVRRVTFAAIAKNKRTKRQGFKFAFAPGGKGALGVKLDESSLSGDQQALMIAKILDSTVRSIRATYTAMIVHKMKNDGFGASLDYTAKQGFVPLPAVFARTIAGNVVSTISSSRLIDISLRSRWNLNKNQSLQTDFEREGWGFLIKQQKARVAESKPLRSLVWEPFVKVSTDGGKSLRYLSADTAAAKACVGCHNNWEQKGTIQAMRRDQGVPPGKIFEDHELMGAISIVVKLDK